MMTMAKSAERMGRMLKVLVGGLASGMLVACQGAGGGRTLADAPVVKAGKVSGVHHGIASVYTDRRTASGERFSAGALTAAHKTLPLGSKAKVTHLGTGRSVVVRINDRGPYVKGRVIDLTPAAAAKIGLTKSEGIAKVRVERVDG